MNVDEERRLADEAHRIRVSERLAALETSQSLNFGELKSILASLHTEVAKVDADLKTVKSTLYGGPTEKIGLLGKMTLATSVIVAVGGFLSHIVMKKIDDIPVQQFIEQSTGKRVQLFNRKTGEYEYFMELPKKK